jgi:hypothetical protein
MSRIFSNYLSRHQIINSISSTMEMVAKRSRLVVRNGKARGKTMKTV